MTAGEFFAIIYRAVERERTRARARRDDLNLDRVKGYIDGYIAALAEAQERKEAHL